MKRKSFKIGPTPGDQFEMLLFVLTQEISFARLHLQIARGLAKQATDEPRTLHCAQTFFALTFRAHLESAYARAARLFDPTSGTVTIPAMISMADQKAGTFQFATAAELRKKIAVWEGGTAKAQPLLSKLHDLRNGLIAHLDKEVILDPEEMARTVAVTFDEVDQILNVARGIVTDALDSYNGATYGNEFVPGSDYEVLFRSLQESYVADDERRGVRPTNDEIAARAYEIYVGGGRTDGHDIADWLRAERELCQLNRINLGSRAIANAPLTDGNSPTPPSAATTATPAVIAASAQDTEPTAG